MTPNPTEAPMHEEMHDWATSLRQERMPGTADAIERYITASEAKDARIAELEREVAELRNREAMRDAELNPHAFGCECVRCAMAYFRRRGETST